MSISLVKKKKKWKGSQLLTMLSNDFSSDIWFLNQQNTIFDNKLFQIYEQSYKINLFVFGRCSISFDILYLSLIFFKVLKTEFSWSKLY